MTVWDRRWLSQQNSSGTNSAAVLEFNPAVNNATPATIWSLRYSAQQRGRLAICSNLGELKVVDMIEGRDSLLHTSAYFPTNPFGGLAWSHNQYVSQTRNVQRPFVHGPDVDSDDRLIAFDWIAGSRDAAAQEIIALRPSRRVDILRVPRCISHATVTARHDFSLAFADLSIVTARTPHATIKLEAPHEQHHTAEDFGPYEYQGESVSGDTHGRKLVCTPNSAQLADLLAASAVQRERCRRGYLFDCQQNMKVALGNWQLERLWEIVNRFREQALDDGMVAARQRLDLSFIGVAAVCLGKLGSHPNRRLNVLAGKIENAIVELAAARDLPPFVGERTDIPENRQLCLEMCGWKFTKDSLEAECQELMKRGLHYQAVVQAVLHDYKHVALNLLRDLIRTKTVPNIGLGALLASDTINAEQREMCLWMAADTDDPALKALLTFLTTGHWRDVMKTNYLHAGYRVALGLKYLNDTELGGFIQSETARAVKNGDLEGILLTGLGEQSMGLFQTYITKTNDLQTAVLATAFTNPLYVDDVRWEMWKETYFMQMQSWRAFSERTKFIVQHSHMARTREGKSLLERPPGQVTLRCQHCQLSLARTDGQSLVDPIAKATPPGATATIALSASAGIVCPQCGRHMPRCGICKMWLGTPDPHRRGGAQDLQKLKDVMARLVTFCVSCEHTFHAHHARSWFQKHPTCPVPGCRCLCTV